MAEAVASSPHLAGLKELDLSWRRMGLEGLKLLADSPHLKNLRRLRLAYCGFPAAAADVVAASPNFTRLYSLELGARADFRFPDQMLTEEMQDRVRAALPDAAVRFE
jgi:hypothetical protein